MNKLTNFPSVEGEIKIASLYNKKLTNKIWRNFCKSVAEYLVEEKGDLTANCQQMDLTGTLWPLNDLRS